MTLDTTRWVPGANEAWRAELPRLLALLERGEVCLLTGAGFSTESGIPDYRGEETARRARNPIRFKQFVSHEHGRRRYWARSMVGWPRFRSAQPNRAHYATVRLEDAGIVSGIITQNVDRLHHVAGSPRVTELHGALGEVLCLSCGRVEPRDDLQRRLEQLNPDFVSRAVRLAPDGDADIAEQAVDDFVVADCASCGGVLKPHVVFFGEAVPRKRVDEAFGLLEASRALVVAGSSLTVFSGYRFVRRARQLGLPVIVINLGPTRADGDATLLVPGQIGAVFDTLERELSPLRRDTAS